MDAYEISTDPARLDIRSMHAYLTRSYWSPGIPFETVERAARNSLCFGLYERATGAQVRPHHRECEAQEGHTQYGANHFSGMCLIYWVEENALQIRGNAGAQRGGESGGEERQNGNQE